MQVDKNNTIENDCIKNKYFMYIRQLPLQKVREYLLQPFG